MTADLWVPGEIDTITMYDAAYLPSPVPAGAQAWMVYAGGSSALHPWPQADLDRVASLPRLPVWVPTPGTDNPRQSALGFVKWLTDHKVPLVAPNGEHTLVLWDLETGREPYPRWANLAANVLAAHGYRNLIYGSVSVIFGQPARAGYFVADPTGKPHLYDHPSVVGTQYVFDVKVPGGTIDKSLFRKDLVDQLWQPVP